MLPGWKLDTADPGKPLFVPVKDRTSVSGPTMQAAPGLVKEVPSAYELPRMNPRAFAADTCSLGAEKSRYRSCLVLLYAAKIKASVGATDPSLSVTLNPGSWLLREDITLSRFGLPRGML